MSTSGGATSTPSARARADLVVATMARLSPDEGLITGVTPCSTLAALLSKTLYDRNQMVVVGAGTVLPLLGSGWTLASLALEPPTLARLSLDQVFDYVHQGRLTIWIAPAQIDEVGNANIACVGPWQQPKVALVGSRGLPDDSVNLRGMCYYVPRHSSRVFVKQVDFVSAIGNERPLPARVDWERSEGVAGDAPDAWGRPRFVVSNLGVFDFGAPGGRMRLISRHPGVSVDEITAQTGFTLHVPAGVPTTPPPSAAAIAALEQLDPDGWRDGEF